MDEPPQKAESVNGRYLGHSTLRGFVYQYDCPRCRETFLSVAPDLNAPTICHRCATGSRSGNNTKRRKK